jgi:hypothetical protein
MLRDWGEVKGIFELEFLVSETDIELNSIRFQIEDDHTHRDTRKIGPGGPARAHPKYRTSGNAGRRQAGAGFSWAGLSPLRIEGRPDRRRC